MQFIKNGPDIPERLLQAHEDGRVIFFCGAGISYPADLPSFRGLIDRVYAQLGTVREPLEDQVYKNRQYDATLDLLERRIPGQREAVRTAVAKSLEPRLRKKGATETHKALLQLGRDRTGTLRLVTTNFDRIFEFVIHRDRQKLPTYVAPLVPIPKNNRWHGLVYLHGLLPKVPSPNELNRLVLSSGDFGLAYLTERWAARFVTELFRNYIVCFLGYSINDPVLRYMMDALAADRRMLGDAQALAYAFGGHAPGDEKTARMEWEAKGVTPVLYEAPGGNHSALHLTIKKWSETYRDGVLGKERIILEYAPAKPLASTKQDDFVGRLLWAISDRGALPAKRFAEHNPLPSLDWLEPFEDRRFKYSDLPRFGIDAPAQEDKSLAFSLASRPTPHSLSSWMQLVVRAGVASRWDDVMHQLARWLARHAGDPNLILWLSKQSGPPHGYLASLIGQELEQHPPTKELLVLWDLVLAGRLRYGPGHHDLFAWRKQFKQDGLTASMRIRLRELLSPRIRVSKAMRIAEEPSKEPTVRDLISWELVLSSDHVHSLLEPWRKDPRWLEALPELLSDATALLKDALDLLQDLGDASDLADGSYVQQPSISDHSQNQDFYDWTVLIKLARDAWIAMAERSRDRARLETEVWWSIPYPTFKRLVFFAAANSTLYSNEESLRWLLADDAWWIWSDETQREALRLLAAIAPRSNEETAKAIEGAILRGPPRKLMGGDLARSQDVRFYDREVWLRLAKWHAAGAALSPEATRRLGDLAGRYPEWTLSEGDQDEFPFWMGDAQDMRRFSPSPKRRRELAAWLLRAPTQEFWHDDDWGERCKKDFPTAATALCQLAKKGEWVVPRWTEALQAWADEKLSARAWRYLAPVLAQAPERVVKELSHAMSWWLHDVAKTFKVREDLFFGLCNKVLDGYSSERTSPVDQVVFEAINHPVGHITEALLRWWYRRQLEDGQGLPDQIGPIFARLCDTEIQTFRHGRVVLTTNVLALFRVDEIWTRKHLLPLFDWDRSTIEARAAWEGFHRSPRLYRPLMEALKGPFLATATHYAELGKHAEQYPALLVFTALQLEDTFAAPELAAATAALPINGLQKAASALARSLEGGGEQRVEFWRNRIQRYVKTIWPKSLSAINSSIAKSFALLSIETADAFPEALRELKHLLQTVEDPDYVVHRLLESALPQRFPEDALTLLDITIPQRPSWLPNDLKACLNVIRTARPQLASAASFKRLNEYVLRQE